MKYEQIFQLKTPFPLLKKHPAPGEGRFQVDEQLTCDISHPIVKKWYDKYSDLGGKHCFLFDKNKIIEGSEKLKEIGLYQILPGDYINISTFQLVDDPCWSYLESRSIKSQYINRFYD